MAKTKVVMAGFYGRGNCGDEALAQRLYEFLSERYKVMISLSRTGAHKDYAKWYPYKDAPVIERSGVGGVLSSDIKGIVVGGGGLHACTAAEHVLGVKSIGGKAIFAGSDMHDLLGSNGNGIFRHHLSLFDLISLRYPEAYPVLEGYGLKNLHLGSDWAVDLPTDNSGDFPKDDKRACITVRFFNEKYHDWHFRSKILGLISSVITAGYRPVFVPFSPEDESLCRLFDPTHSIETIVAWSNPRRVKELFACSGLVVSVGRLHPLIFAGPVGVPVVYVVPPITTNPHLVSIAKIRSQTEEWGIPICATVEALADRLAEGVAAVEAARIEVSMQRLAAMKERIVQVLD